ncbi:MAG: hypothetical protein SPK79_06310, partial [Erysipelotrichaceae bacterium]|nr:hypothetical protein [Erysipelotrichaceae bacterium]
VSSLHTGAKFKITGITEDSIILNMALNMKFEDIDKHLIIDDELKHAILTHKVKTPAKPIKKKENPLVLFLYNPNPLLVRITK